MTDADADGEREKRKRRCSTRDARQGRTIARRSSESGSASSTAASPALLGSRVHTSERRGGVERRQMELKGVEGGD